MYRAIAEPMLGNPAKTVGDKTGLWQVVIYEKIMGQGNVFLRVHADNLQYEEARTIATQVEQGLNV